LPNEWSNELTMYCNNTRLDYNTIEEFSDGALRKSYYLTAIKDHEILSASDVLNLNETTGELNNYPEVRFISAHRIIYQIHSKICKYGGKIVVELPPEVKFNNQDIENRLDHSFRVSNRVL